MREPPDNRKPAKKRSTARLWIRRGFILWAVFSTTWILNSFRTQGVAPALLSSDTSVKVRSSPESLSFLPVSPSDAAGLLFIVGAGVAAEAYAPLLRPLAESGHPVYVVRLPYRVAPLERHKKTAIARARSILLDNDSVARWIIAGHSLGGALACRLAPDAPENVGAMVLIGTSHPKSSDLSQMRIPITKVFATSDGVATVDMINATKDLLPRDTRWVEIQGGNHSQFGHYGHQLLDGSPTITREHQQEITRTALLDAREHAQ